MLEAGSLDLISIIVFGIIAITKMITNIVLMAVTSMFLVCPGCNIARWPLPGVCRSRKVESHLSCRGWLDRAWCLRLAFYRGYL